MVDPRISYMRQRRCGSGAVDPMVGVTQDAASGVYVPASASEWTTTMAAAGVATGNPDSLWLMQESSGDLTDTIGSRTLVAHGSPAYSQPISGMTRLGVKPTTDTFDYFQSTGVDVSASSQMLLMILGPGVLGNGRTIAFMGAGPDWIELKTNSSGSLSLGDGPNTGAGTGAPASPSIVIVKVDRSRSEAVLYINGDETVKPTWADPSAGDALYIGGVIAAWPDTAVAYAALFTGAAAEMSDADVAALISTMKGG